MTKVVYEVVEHDGGWAYRVNGVFSETFPSHDLAHSAAERAAKEQVVPGDPTGISYEDRMVVGTTKRRQVVIDPRPTSRAEIIFRRRPENLGRRESRVADGGSTALRIGARWCMIAAPIYPQSVGPERMGTRWLTSIWK